jgi:hypothetical protein
MIKQMKTIQVTDEMHDALMALSKEMTTQDNRGTAIPHLFQIKETNKVPAHDGFGDKLFYNQDLELELRDSEEIKEWICENIDTLEVSEDVNTFDIINVMDDSELNEILLDNNFSEFYDSDGHTYSNAFFTSKACDEHIRINRHNLHQPINYLNHAFRNPEMELVSKFLCELTGGKLRK